MAGEYTQDDLNRLTVAISSGTLHVAFADRSQTFHSLEDMLKLRSIMIRELAGEGGVPLYRLAATAKGL